MTLYTSTSDRNDIRPHALVGTFQQGNLHISTINQNQESDNNELTNLLTIGRFLIDRF